jgi:hypothetical protein
VSLGLALREAGGHETRQFATGGSRARSDAPLDLAQVEALVRLGHQEGQNPAPNGGSADGQIGRDPVLKHEDDRSHTWNNRTPNREQVNVPARAAAGGA